MNKKVKIKLSDLMTDKEFSTYDYTKRQNDLELSKLMILKEIKIEPDNNSNKNESKIKKEQEYYKQILEKQEILINFIYK